VTDRINRQHAVTPQDRGRFPGYDVLDQVDRWDELTAGVVLARLSPSTHLRFFTDDEGTVASRLLDLLLAQDVEPRIPVLALIDERLAAGETDGWHYDDLPEDGDAWRQTLAFLDSDAHRTHDRGFATLPAEDQAPLVQAVYDADRWHDMPAAQVWSLWTRYACTAFYSHPWAWNEIGFGGPAYPRGYKNLRIDGRERWEVSDHDPDDPVPFAQRVEHAHADHAELVGRAPDDQ
jgi:hypothetical protein